MAFINPKIEEMKNFKIILTRSYVLNVSSNNIESAKEVAEFFIGDPKDESNKDQQKKYLFKINDVEMVLNEAYEADEVEL